MSGRKRHVLVDTEGTLLKACVHPADIHDPLGGSEAASLRESRRGAELLLEGLNAEFPRIALVWADSAYQGLKAWLAEALGWKLTISKHWWTGLRGVWVAPSQQPPAIPRGFHVLKRRWVVERTFAWLGNYRRLSKDYEFLPATEESLIYLAMSRLMLRRLCRPAKR